MRHKNNSLLTLIALAIGIFFASTLITFADWIAPADVPPNCAAGSPGCDAPLNVSLNGQVKDGGLTVGYNPTVTNGLLVRYGNVGIGTLQPLFKLHAMAPGGFGSENASGQALAGNVPIVGQLAPGGSGTAFGLLNNDARPVFALNIEGDNNLSTQRGYPVFYDRYNGAWNASLYLRNGRVGIGNSDPQAALNVKSSGAARTKDLIVYGRIQTGTAARDDGGVWLSDDGSGFVGNNGDSIGFYTNGRAWDAFQIAKATGDIRFGGTLTKISDYGVWMGGENVSNRTVRVGEIYGRAGIYQPNTSVSLGLSSANNYVDIINGAGTGYGYLTAQDVCTPGGAKCLSQMSSGGGGISGINVGAFDAAFWVSRPGNPAKSITGMEWVRCIFENRSGSAGFISTSGGPTGYSCHARKFVVPSTSDTRWYVIALCPAGQKVISGGGEHFPESGNDRPGNTFFTTPDTYGSFASISIAGGSTQKDWPSGASWSNNHEGWTVVANNSASYDGIRVYSLCAN